MSKYRIHWNLSDSGKEIVTAGTEEEARKAFKEIPLTELVGTNENIARIMQIARSEELKPCPFCGSEAYIEEIEPHKHSAWLKKAVPKIPDCAGGTFVFCTRCSASIAAIDRQSAIRAWNWRAEA